MMGRIVEGYDFYYDLATWDEWVWFPKLHHLILIDNDLSEITGYASDVTLQLQGRKTLCFVATERINRYTRTKQILELETIDPGRVNAGYKSWAFYCFDRQIACTMVSSAEMNLILSRDYFK